MNRRLALALVFFFGRLTSSALAETSIEGHVPLPKPRSAPVMNKRYEIVTKGGTVSTNPPIAVVYLEGVFPKSEKQPVGQMSQKDLAFAPMILPIRVGTKVEFPNLDDTYHNIFSFSAAKRFDLGRYRSEERPIPYEIFDLPGLVTLRCDIHEHMRGLILVVDTPHFVLSDTEGHYVLNGLPAGDYVLKAWVDSKTTLEHPIHLEQDAKVHFDFP